MLVFDHVGLTTTEPQPDENWIEQSRCWVTNPRNHPEHIEFLRYARGHDGSRGRVETNPHVAFRVESLEPHIKGQEILIPPFVVADFVARRVHPQVRNGLRVHAVSERQLVRRLSARARQGRMSYQAIYAYAWDLAEVGASTALERFASLGLDTVTLAGQLPCRQVPAPAWKDGQGLFPAGRHRLFHARFEALRPDQAGVRIP